MERPVLYETVSSGLAAESRDNVRFEVTDVSTQTARLPVPSQLLSLPAPRPRPPARMCRLVDTVRLSSLPAPLLPSWRLRARFNSIRDASALAERAFAAS